MQKTYKEISVLAAEAGVSVSDLCVQSKVNPQTVRKWCNKEPRTLEILRSLRAKAEDLKSV